VQSGNDDEAWRSIVENYGDRARLDPDEPTRQEPREAEPSWDEGSWPEEGADAEPDWARQDGEDEAFVPPPPPPLPRVAPKRLVAWTGVFGSPTVLLTALLFGVSLPAWLGYLLVAAFVGGFVYLVAMMPRGPRDPFDDGARL
jgi:hypothetical protein